MKWDKVDIDKYKVLTERRLKILSEDMPVEAVVQLNSTLVSAAQCALAPKATCKPKTFAWSPTSLPLVREMKQYFYVWKQCGRPDKPDNIPQQKFDHAKKVLRSTQKQAMAENRQERHRQMETSENDQSLLYKLNRCQHNDSPDNLAMIKFKFDPDNTHTQVENWATYYEELATPKDLQHFDDAAP